jgi:hypothetical protein
MIITQMMAMGSVFAGTPYTISADTTNYNLRAAMVAAGWNQTSPLNIALTINSGIVVSSNATGTSGFVIDGAYPTGSIIRIINNGYIVGMGGAGGNGAISSMVGKSVTLISAATSGLAGGTALTVAPSVPANVSVLVTNNGIIGGGGGGGGGAYSVGQVSSPGGGGGQTGRTNSAGGGGGYGSNAGTFAGAGAGLSPGGNGNSGAGGGWGGSGAIGYAWPGDYQVTSGGAGGPATSGTANITWVVTGTRYGTIG